MAADVAAAAAAAEWLDNPSSPPDCLTPHTAEESVLGVQVSHIDTSLKCRAADAATAVAASEGLLLQMRVLDSQVTLQYNA